MELSCRPWRVWRDICGLSEAARFRHNVVIIKPYCRLKIELTSFEIHKISFRNTGFFLCVCVWRSFLWLLLLLSMAFGWCIPDLVRTYVLVFLRLFKRPEDCYENSNEKGLSFQGLSFPGLSLSSRTSQKQPFFFRVTSIRLSAGRQDSRNYWIQMWIIEYKYIFTEYKCELLNTNIFSLNTNMNYWIQI